MNWVARYVGARFEDGGRGPDTYDCWGVPYAVYRDILGIDLPDYGEISAADLLRVRREIARGSSTDPWTPVETPQPFDVAVMRLPTGRGHGHVGVVVDSEYLLHAEAGSGVALESINAFTIRNRIMGYWRHARA